MQTENHEANIGLEPYFGANESETYTEHFIQYQLKIHPSQVHMEHSHIDYMSSHKTRLTKFKTELMLGICSNHNGMKLANSDKRKAGKFTNI